MVPPKKPTSVGFFRARMYNVMLQIPTMLFLISFTLLAVLHNLAIWLYLYWRLLWLDIPMHVLGGVVVALGVYTLRDLRVLTPTWLSIFGVLAIVLIIALMWEVFEVYAGVPLDAYYYPDTAMDIMMGLTGGLIGHYIGKKLTNF